MRNTNCQEVKPLLIDYVDENLDREKKTIVEEHLSICELCSKDMEEIRTLFAEFETVVNEEPPKTMKEEFKQMLNLEIARSEKHEDDIPRKDSISILTHWYRSWWFNMAAGLVLLITGAITGRIIWQGNIRTEVSVNELADIKHEVQGIKELMMESLLSEQLPSAKIRFIDSVRFAGQPDEELTDILLTALNNDQNVNVRFAAAQSLARLSESEKIRLELMESLVWQREPLIQIVLINILVRMEETRAVDIMKQLMYNPENHELVREEAQRGIKILT
jgi:hypothetical protein